MSKFNHQLSQFTIVGQFLGYVISKKAQIKYLRIGILQQEHQIKLPKKIRHHFDWNLMPGCWLLVEGKKELCLKTGLIQLKAELVTPAAGILEGAGEAGGAGEVSYINSPSSPSSSSAPSSPSTPLLYFPLG